MRTELGSIVFERRQSDIKSALVITYIFTHFRAQAETDVFLIDSTKNRFFYPDLSESIFSLELIQFMIFLMFFILAADAFLTGLSLFSKHFSSGLR